MEIQEFVKIVITDIVKGVKQASDELSAANSGAIINPEVRDRVDIAIEPGLRGSRLVQSVEMSIAVTVSEDASRGGKVGLNVAWLSAGAASGQSFSNSTVSTVKF